MTAKPAFGERVTFTHWIERRTEVRYGAPPDTPRSEIIKVWRTVSADEPTGGIVIGVRTLSDGKIRDYGLDEPSVYVPERHFTAYFVAFGMRRNPVFVLPEHIEAP